IADKKLIKKENKKNLFLILIKKIDNKRHEYLLSEVDIVNDLINTNKSKAIELIDGMQHFSKDKFNLSDDKKFMIFNDNISYKEYWGKTERRIIIKNK
ncbi:hypothetical protein, partial [Brachyspira hampsonii]|uniref:hypothetical protein n=1 Tax=Brachyspira hampsonii TaxID=1287055 RepID=UPI0002AE383C